MQISLNSVSDDVNDSLSGSMLPESAIPASSLIQGPLSVRHNSKIYYAECDLFPTPVAVKLCLIPHTDKPDCTSAREQFDALQRVSEKMNTNPIYRVPTPYKLHEDLGIVIMEWMDGRSMSDLLFSFGSTFEESKRLVKNAAQWLRLFHHAHEVEPKALDIEEKLEKIAGLRKLDIANNIIFLAALNQLENTARKAASKPLTQSWIHGDFKTDNLIVAEPEIVGIDIHIRHINATLYDVGPFLNRIELACYHPKAWHFAVVRKGLIELFKQTYFSDKLSSEKLALSWVRLYSLLSVWAMSEKRQRRGIRNMWLRWGFQTITRNLITELNQLSK